MCTRSQQKKNIRFNCWCHFFLFLSFIFAMLYSTRDLVIVVYLIYMYVYNCICIPARALAFVFVFHSHKKNTNICICFEQKLTFWVETIIVIVMHVMLRLKRIKVQTIWLEWIFFSKVGFIRLMCKWNSRAFSFHMHAHFTWTKQNP